MTGTSLSRVSLAATLALTSHAEYAAGVASGLPLWHPWGEGSHAGLAVGLPWLLPVAIDCYVVDALERRRGGDRWAALGILAASVIGGSAYTAATGTSALKAAGVGVILVLVLSRLYAPTKATAPAVARVASPPARKAAPVAPPKAVVPKATPAPALPVSPQVTPGGTVADRILSALLEAPATRAQLVASTGAADGTVKKELTALKAAGRIEQDPTRAHHWRAHVALKAVAR